VTAINGVPARRFRAGIGCGGGRIDAHFTDAASGCMTCGSSPPRRRRAAGHGPRATGAQNLRQRGQQERGPPGNG
jgi:hypothetical protein